MRLKKFVAVGAAFSLLGLAACGNDDGSGGDAAVDKSSETSEEQSDKGAEGEGESAPSMPEPDLEGIPEVVAEVNGEEIGKAEFTTAYEGRFQQAAMQSQMSGEKPDEEKLKEETAQSMVDTELLIQEAEDRGLDATDKEVDQTLAELAKSNQMKPKEFIKALGEQGMDEEEVRSQVKTQVQIDELVAEEAGNIDPTQKELRAAYDAAAQQQGGQGQQKMPPFKQVRSQLEEQVRAEKEAQVGQKLAKDLREDADVTIHL